MLKNLFHVETLDTRFASKTGEPHPRSRSSRWNTPEYYCYYLVFLTIPILMFKSVYDVSQPDHPNYSRFEPLLDEGWIPGRKVDNSDAQYAGFRDNVPYMVLVLILHPLLRRAYEKLATGMDHALPSDLKNREETIAAREADARLQRRVAFDLGFATIYLIAMHGISVLKIFIILYLNYQIATKLPRSSIGVTTWIFNIAVLFTNELCKGYRLGDMVGFALPLHTMIAGEKSADLTNWGTWLDGYGGLIPRWEILFNITVLRLIAFNFDCLWSHDRRSSSPIEVRLFPFIRQ